MSYMLNSPNPLTRIQYYKRRYNRAYGVSIQWWGLLQACYHYAIPNRDLFYWTNQTQGAQKQGKVYDTTAVASTRNFVSKVQNALTPPQQVWAQLSPGDDIPEDMKEEVEEYCEIVTEKIFKYIRRSNFDLAINECYYDLAVGTAALMIMEGESDDSPLRFYSVPVNQLAVEESINGLIDSAYRTYGEVKISDIPIMWPDAVLPNEMKVALENDPNAMCKSLWEGIIYIEGTPKPYRTVLWTDAHILIEREDTSSPWIVFRWNKINNETMGRGPLQDALPSIMSLNELARLELTSANLNVCKPYMAYSDGVFSPYLFNLQPNTIIPIAPNANGQFPIQPLPDVANPQFFQLTSNDLRQQINTLLYSNPLGAVQDAPTRTATELALRQRNLAEEIGPIFTRLQQEFLARTIKRIVHVLKKRGLIEPIVINGKELDLKYQSPLVIAQGQLDVQGFLQYFQALQGIFGPEGAIVYVNPVELPIWMAERLNIDPRILNKKEELEATFKSQSEMQQLTQMQSLGLPAGVPGTMIPGS